MALHNTFKNKQNKNQTQSYRPIYTGQFSVT